ncbi:MAG: FAD-dependent 5-carboxymethylaminomethyl-2-thiouridine(34) oxidoreductase MnmC [Ramlibacter sp.]
MTQTPTQGPPGPCVVVGGGIAGAAVAASLARRGGPVQVLDAAAEPAGGASALPVGLFAPHVSPDDAILSRLTRAGVQATLAQARALLREGLDWQLTGVLEHGLKPAARERRQLPAGATEFHGTRLAAAAELQRAGLPADAPALWHAQAGWLKPAALVRALLAQPGIVWRGRTPVSGLVHDGSAWQVLDAQGALLARAAQVVVAAGPASSALLGGHLPLQPLRGQIAWAPHAPGAAGLPPFPVNGHGSLIAGIPHRGAPAWFVGSTFERDSTDGAVRPADHAANLARLHTLLPAAGLALAGEFAAGRVQGWAGVRATLPDRLPAVGPVDAANAPGLLACTGMGARGLTLAVLCGELLAAGLHGEPLPLDAALARALAASRFRPTGPSQNGLQPASALRKAL